MALKKIAIIALEALVRYHTTDIQATTPTTSLGLAVGEVFTLERLATLGAKPGAIFALRDLAEDGYSIKVSVPFTWTAQSQRSILSILEPIATWLNTEKLRYETILVHRPSSKRFAHLQNVFDWKLHTITSYFSSKNDAGNLQVSLPALMLVIEPDIAVRAATQTAWNTALEQEASEVHHNNNHTYSIMPEKRLVVIEGLTADMYEHIGQPSQTITPQTYHWLGNWPERPAIFRCRVHDERQSVWFVTSRKLLSTNIDLHWQVEETCEEFFEKVVGLVFSDWHKAWVEPALLEKENQQRLLELKPPPPTSNRYQYEVNNDDDDIPF
jgi:hypothetical protein